MRCIIYDSEMIGFENLTLWVARKGFIVYHTTQMTYIHEDETYFPKFKKWKNLTTFPQAPCDHELVNSWN